MDKWDYRFIELADHIAQWSKDPSTKVGAVITDGKRIVSLGFNGPPAYTRDSDFDRDEKLRRTIHGEANAILFAERSLFGCTIYTNRPPCAKCAAMIIQSGITRVVTVSPDPEFADRWVDDMSSAKAMFDEAEVQYEVV